MSDLKRKYESDENVYTGQITIRSKSNVVNSLKSGEFYLNQEDRDKYNSQLTGILSNHILTNNQFCIILIELNSDSLHRLFENDSYNRLPYELAEIYHFHLHPEHQPSIVSKLPKFNDSSRFVIFSVLI